MNNIFKSLFNKYKFTAAEIDTFTRDFYAVVLTTLIGASKDKLSEEEQKIAATRLNEGGADAVIGMIKGKYSDEEWENVIETHIVPLWQSYLSDVVGVKV